MWNLQTGQCVRAFHGHDDDITSFVFSPNGQLISGSHDHTIKIWSLFEDEF